MIVSTNPQNSEAWYQERTGLLTSSNAKRIITSKGIRSKSYNDYVYVIAEERITGKRVDSYYNKDMENGHIMENAGCEFFECSENVTIEKVGLCYYDEKKEFGGSPDGLINDDDGFENKNASVRVQLKRLEDGWTGSEHYVQNQMNMLVTDRKRWFLQSYCEGLQNIVIEVMRDEEFLKKLRIEIKLFNKDVQNKIDKYSI